MNRNGWLFFALNGAIVTNIVAAVVFQLVVGDIQQAILSVGWAILLQTIVLEK